MYTTYFMQHHMESTNVVKFREKFIAASDALDLGLENVKAEETTSGKKKQKDIRITWIGIDGEEDHTDRKVCGRGHGRIVGGTL